MKRIIFISLIFLRNPLFTQDQMFVGTRPMSMGGAFIAVADDGNTITWNPAGLPRLRRTEFTTSYADLYVLGITQSYIGIVRPFGDKLALGIDWANVGHNDGELGYVDNKLNFSFGYQPHKIISFGSTVKYIFKDMTLDGTSYGKSSGIGYDAGILISPLKNLRFGLGLFDLGGTDVSYEDKITETILGQAFKLGIAYMPIDGLTLAADIGDRYHLGTEYVLKIELNLATNTF